MFLMNNTIWERIQIFAQVDGGPHSRVTFKHLPKVLRSPKFGTLGQLFKIAPFSSQKCIVRGEGVVAEIVAGWAPYPDYAYKLCHGE